MMATVIALAAAIVTPLEAHDLERTQVTLTLERNGRFDLLVSNDPRWLLMRLEPFGSAPPPTAGSLSESERNARLEALAPVFRDRIVLFVDGHEIRPDTVAYVPPDGRPPVGDVPSPASYRLRGQMPAGARVLRWFYGLVIDPYPLALHLANGRKSTEMVLGDAWSGSIDLIGQPSAASRRQEAWRYLTLGFTRVLPSGPEHVIFVLGLLLLGRTSSRAITSRLVAFVLAVTGALSLGALGLVTLPPRIVEPLVALSMALIALDGFTESSSSPSSLRGTAWRHALIAACGGLHGLRLADVVSRDAGLPANEPATALLSLNLGVTGAELVVVAVGVACLLCYRERSWYRERIAIPASVAIAGASAYWTVVIVAGA
jgi:hypothetical protein